MSRPLSSERDGSGRSILEALEPFSRLNPQVLHALEAIGEVQTFQSDQTVMTEGQHSTFIGVVHSGILRVPKSLPDGRRHIVSLLVKGDIFGRVFDGPMPYAIEAATSSTVICFRRSPFESLILREPELDQMIVRDFLNEIDRAREWMIVLGNPRVRGRIAALLMILVTRYGRLPHLVSEKKGTLSLQLPIGRQDIADLLGTRPESISRALHALQGDGIIELVRPDLIAIHALEALASEAGEELPADVVASHDLTTRKCKGQNQKS